MKSDSFLKSLLIVAALAAGLVYVIKRTADQEQRGGLAAGNPAPAIAAAGWLNGDGPGDLSGKVVVVHGWFTTCHFCRNETPELARVVEKYSPQGVQFISLTFEDERMMPAIEKFVADTGMNWLTGYGARQTLRDFEAAYFPCMWVVNADGQIVWSTDSDEDFEAAIEAAVSQRPASS